MVKGELEVVIVMVRVRGVTKVVKIGGCYQSSHCGRSSLKKYKWKVVTKLEGVGVGHQSSGSGRRVSLE